MNSFSRYFRLSTSPFWLVHLASIAAFFMEFSWKYVLIAVGSYYLRMFFVTGGYHRYFSHKTYSTSRAFQFILAFMSQTTVQKGALWWASHHRHHHKYSDMPQDIHSPKDGFWYSHVGWILDDKHNEVDEKYIRDLMRFPELVWLNNYHLVPVVVYATVMFLLWGLPGLVWGFCISTVFLWHGTFTINSLSHVWGWRRYVTTDTSRNNPVLALVTMGEGWHNNHHRYQASARNGFFWWEIDLTYYVLKLLSLFRIVWDLRPVPKNLLDPSHEAWIKNHVETAKVKAIETAEAMSFAAKQTVEVAKQKVEEVAHSAQEMANAAMTQAEEAAETMKVSIEESKEKIAAQGEEFAQKVEQVILPSQKIA